ncbi:hypothetical protein ACLBWT_03030 [Paenibacillus sp. D51F]
MIDNTVRDHRIRKLFPRDWRADTSSPTPFTSSPGILTRWTARQMER